MNKINRILFSIIVFCTIIPTSHYTFAQELDQAKLALQNYIDSWFVNYDQEDWLVEINGIKFPVKGMEIGLNALEKNLKTSGISKKEKQQIKNRFIQTYIDQSALLAVSYKDLLANPQVDILLQEFLRQAATQLWLENQMQQNPDAIVPSTEEINAYYQENSDRLLRLGLSASQIKTYTEQELRQTKLQTWTFKQLTEFKTENPTTINPKMKKKFGIK